MFNKILIEPLANGLILSYNLLFENLGLAIVGFSLFLRVILNPLTKPYMQSMKKMKDIAPLVEKLKKKHQGDKMKFAAAQSELYKQKGIKPGAGCLPYLLQIVVLIAFFNVFNKTLSPQKNPAVEFNQFLYQPLKFAEGETLNTRFLYLDVRNPDVFRLPQVPFPIPGPILILSALAQLAVSKMMMPSQGEKKMAKKTKSKEDDMQTTMQQSMAYTFPLFTIIFGMSFSSGLAIYWFIFSLFQIFQQYTTSGWGGLTPFLSKAGLLKSQQQNGKSVNPNQ